MKNKKNIGTILSELLRKNTFLMILSIFLAVFVWIYILYIENPVNEVVFDKVEVSLSYEGSVPERNGYMYLMTDTNLTVSVTVSGSRSELLNLSQDDIKATLNMDSVISEGTYSIGVSVNTQNKNLTVSEVYPKSFTIEFAEKATKTIPLELYTTGELSSGYIIQNFDISPKEITVTGPAKTIEQLHKAYLTVSLTNIRENIQGSYEISLVNEFGENIDRRFLTLSDAAAEALLTIKYRKVIPTAVDIINSSGGDESGYITITLDTQTIEGIGSEKDLAPLQTYTVGTIDTSTLKGNEKITLTVPQLDGTTLNKEQIVANVTFNSGISTKVIRFTQEDINCINVPSGKTAKISNRTVDITIRAKEEDLRNLSNQNLKCLVDLSEQNEDGTYSILVTSVSGISYGVVGGPYNVEVIIQ